MKKLCLPGEEEYKRNKSNDPQYLQSDNCKTRKIKYLVNKFENIKVKNINPLSKSQSLDEVNSKWNVFKRKIKNFKNKIKYNTIKLNSSLDFYKFDKLRMFDKDYLTKSDLRRFCYDLYFTIYFSYRNDFHPIMSSRNNEVTYFTSDCGWGCMIRSAQMILAQALVKVKLSQQPYTIKNLYGVENLEFIFEIIHQFLDSEYTTMEGEKELPLYSITNICKNGEYVNKQAGEWFSDISMIQIFEQILHSNIRENKSYEIISFSDGVVYNSDILNKCFKEVNRLSANCKHTEYYENKEGNKYIMIKPGIIFISVRLGLESFPEEYCSSLREIFQIQGNIGIIGGKSNEARYFIGQADNFFIYLDPHYNQKSIKTAEDLKERSDTFFIKKAYQMEIKDISPALTIGFAFTEISEYISLFESFSNYSVRQFPCFKFTTNERKIEEVIISTNSNSYDDGFELV
jgi:cysteine protease ATG4